MFKKKEKKRKTFVLFLFFCSVLFLVGKSEWDVLVYKYMKVQWLQHHLIHHHEFQEKRNVFISQLILIC